MTCFSIVWVAFEKRTNTAEILIVLWILVWDPFFVLVYVESNMACNIVMFVW